MAGLLYVSLGFGLIVSFLTLALGLKESPRLPSSMPSNNSLLSFLVTGLYRFLSLGTGLRSGL